MLVASAWVADLPEFDGGFHEHTYSIDSGGADFGTDFPHGCGRGGGRHCAASQQFGRV
jgi:hypothetical protein